MELLEENYSGLNREKRNKPSITCPAVGFPGYIRSDLDLVSRTGECAHHVHHVLSVPDPHHLLQGRLFPQHGDAVSLLETPDEDAGTGLEPVAGGAQQSLHSQTQLVVLRPESVPGETLPLLGEVVEDHLVQSVSLHPRHLPPRLPVHLQAGAEQPEGRGQVLLDDEAPGLGEQEADDGGVEEGEGAGMTRADRGVVQVLTIISVITPVIINTGVPLTSGGLLL